MYFSCRKRGNPTFKKALCLGWVFLVSAEHFFQIYSCNEYFIIFNWILISLESCIQRAFIYSEMQKKNYYTAHTHFLQRLILYKERKREKPWEFLAFRNGNSVWFCILNFRRYAWFKLTHFSYKWMEYWTQLMKTVFQGCKKWLLFLSYHV